MNAVTSKVEISLHEALLFSRQWKEHRDISFIKAIRFDRMVARAVDTKGTVDCKFNIAVCPFEMV